MRYQITVLPDEFNWVWKSLLSRDYKSVHTSSFDVEKEIIRRKVVSFVIVDEETKRIRCHLIPSMSHELVEMQTFIVKERSEKLKRIMEKI